MKTEPNDTITAHESNALGHIGLTKREYMATAILQGMGDQLLSENYEYTEGLKIDIAKNQMKVRAMEAVLQADFLIEALNNPRPRNEAGKHAFVLERIKGSLK